MKKLIDNLFNKKIAIHFLIVIGFIFFSLSYFYPLLSGKIPLQSDINQYTGMSRQLNEFRSVGEEIYWIENGGEFIDGYFYKFEDAEKVFWEE